MGCVISMNIDLLITLIFLIFTSFLAYTLKDRFKTNALKLTKKETQYSKKFTVLVALIGITFIFIVANSPANLISYLYVSLGILIIGTLIFFLTYNKYLPFIALLYPVIYFLGWNLILMNIFAIIMATTAILVMNTFLSTNRLALLLSLLLIADIITVLITQDMIRASEKVVSTKTPVMVASNIGPKPIGLGVGDIFFAGLLTIKIGEYKEFNLNKILILLSLSVPIIYIVATNILSIVPGIPATVLVVGAILISWMIMEVFNYLINYFSLVEVKDGRKS